MNVTFNSFSRASFQSFNLQAFTPDQIKVAKLALSVIALVSLIGLVLLIDGRIRRTVTVTEPNGDTHRSLVEKVNGKAKIIYDSFNASGAILEGEFTHGKLNGQGKVTIDFLGTISEGEYKDDELVKGKITYANGKTEEGEFIRDRKHPEACLNGQGKITYPDGKVEEGKFEFGKLV